eukprot:IDg17240t1
MSLKRSTCRRSPSATLSNLPSPIARRQAAALAIVHTHRCGANLALHIGWRSSPYAPNLYLATSAYAALLKLSSGFRIFASVSALTSIIGSVRQVDHEALRICLRGGLSVHSPNH